MQTQKEMKLGFYPQQWIQAHVDIDSKKMEKTM